jgi:polyhydroxyalkanoate synthesis regulator phasin
MLESLKQALYAGVGMVHMTAEKAREMGEKLVRDAGISEQDGRKFVDELVKKSNEAKTAADSFVRKAVDSTLKALKVPTRSEFDELARRVAAIEGRLTDKDHS